MVQGKLAGPHTVAVSGRQAECDTAALPHIILATGARARQLARAWKPTAS